MHTDLLLPSLQQSSSQPPTPSQLSSDIATPTSLSEPAAALVLESLPTICKPAINIEVDPSTALLLNSRIPDDLPSFESSNSPVIDLICGTPTVLAIPPHTNCLSAKRRLSISASPAHNTPFRTGYPAINPQQTHEIALSEPAPSSPRQQKRVCTAVTTTKASPGLSIRESSTHEGGQLEAQITMQNNQLNFAHGDPSDRNQPDMSAYIHAGQDDPYMNQNQSGLSVSAMGTNPIWDPDMPLNMDIDFTDDDVQLFAQQHFPQQQQQHSEPQLQPQQHQQQQHLQHLQLHPQNPFTQNSAISSFDSWNNQDTQMFNSHSIATAGSLSLPLPAGSPQQMQQNARSKTLASTSPPVPASLPMTMVLPVKRRRPLAAKPLPSAINTSVAADIAAMSPTFPSPMLENPTAVNPGLIYSQSPCILDSPSSFAPISHPQPPPLESTIPDGAVAMADSSSIGYAGNSGLDPISRSSSARELYRSTSLKENKSTMNVAAAKLSRPNLQRSFSDARSKRSLARPANLSTLAPAIRSKSPGIGVNGVKPTRPLIGSRSMSGDRVVSARSLRLAQLTSSDVSQKPAVSRSRPASPSVKFVIDAMGRAHAEALPPPPPPKPSRRHPGREQDRRSRSYSPAEYYDSSSDDEPIIIPGRGSKLGGSDDRRSTTYNPLSSYRRSPDSYSGSTRATPSEAHYSNSPLELDDSDLDSESMDKERASLSTDNGRGAREGNAMCELLKVRESRRKHSSEVMVSIMGGSVDGIPNKNNKSAAKMNNAASIKNGSSNGTNFATKLGSRPTEARSGLDISFIHMKFPNSQAPIATQCHDVQPGLNIAMAPLIQATVGGKVGQGTTPGATTSTIRCICQQDAPEQVGSQFMVNW
ncbi:PHD finger protein 20 [Ceratocystis lukuohia]|uniref:PHD finger protein 20 n=1 Tax=Ceratocystis lukuohia TaxID=2019550 RepID=A0ABR4MLL9_9PEZI